MQILLVQVEVQAGAYPTNKYFKVAEHLRSRRELHKYMSLLLVAAAAVPEQVLITFMVGPVGLVDAVLHLSLD
jgi:hypothetical protein